MHTGSAPRRIDTGPGSGPGLGPANDASFPGPARPSPSPNPGPGPAAGSPGGYGLAPPSGDGGDGGLARMPMPMPAPSRDYRTSRGGGGGVAGLNDGGFEGLNMYAIDTPYMTPSDMDPTAGVGMGMGGVGTVGLMMPQQSQQSDDPYSIGNGDPYAAAVGHDGAASSFLGHPAMDRSLSPTIASEKGATICGMCGEFYPNGKRPC